MNLATLEHECEAASRVVREMLTAVDEPTRDALNAMLDLMDAHMALTRAMTESK